MYRYFILLKTGKLIVSKRRFKSYSGANGAMQSYLLKMHTNALAKLSATSVTKISA